MKAYHGSSVLFDSFDLAHALEGDGKCKFGYGVYVTENYGSAAVYSFNKSRPENRDHYIYTLSIPDRTPDNCLTLLKNVPVYDSIIQRTEQKLGITIPAEARAQGFPFRKYIANTLTGVKKTIKQMTEKSTVDGEKAASRFLLSIGIELIEWPVDWGEPGGLKHYVVLDSGKIQIERIDKVELDYKHKHHLIPGSERQIR